MVLDSILNPDLTADFLHPSDLGHRLLAGEMTGFLEEVWEEREYDNYLGWTLFGVVWGLALVGIVLNSIDLKRYKIFSMICYLIMGWCIIFRINILVDLLGNVGFILLLLGGIIYTLGAVFYLLGKKHKWMHTIFHIGCVIGSLLHFLCILLYVI